MFLLDREAFRITRRLVGWILQQKVQSHNIQYALRYVQKPLFELVSARKPPANLRPVGDFRFYY